MKRYTESELYAFVSRADTHEKVEIAKAFIAKLDYIDNDLFDGLMISLAWISRDLYYQDREYGPSNPWDAPGMAVSDFIRGVH